MSDSEQKLRPAMIRIAEMAQAAVDSGQYIAMTMASRMAKRRGVPISTRVAKTCTVRSSNCPAV